METRAGRDLLITTLESSPTAERSLMAMGEQPLAAANGDG
jgi:hypothetical protein